MSSDAIRLTSTHISVRKADVNFKAKFYIGEDIQLEIQQDYPYGTIDIDMTVQQVERLKKALNSLSATKTYQKFLVKAGIKK